MLQEWVCSESSLTARVKTLGDNFSIDLLNQSFKCLTSAQQKDVCTLDKMALVREVILKQGDNALIYAQTIIPEATLISTNQRLAELGNSSLGDLLFNDPVCSRGTIQVAEIESGSALANFIDQKLNQTLLADCFIRRSLFTLNGETLLVNECFLPAINELIDAGSPNSLAEKIQVSGL
jgi:chorismate lyase